MSGNLAKGIVSGAADDGSYTLYSQITDSLRITTLDGLVEAV